MGPLLSKASIHANMAGVFKGSIRTGARADRYRLTESLHPSAHGAPTASMSITSAILSSPSGLLCSRGTLLLSGQHAVELLSSFRCRIRSQGAEREDPEKPRRSLERVRSSDSCVGCPSSPDP